MLNQEGFLSFEMDKVEKSFEEEYSLIFGRVKNYNIFFQETSFKFIIKRSEIQHWCLAALYLRALSTYQSIILLSKKGITREANVLLRSLMELKYLIIAIARHPTLVYDYLGQEAIEMKKILKNSKRWNGKYAK